MSIKPTNKKYLLLTLPWFLLTLVVLFYGLVYPLHMPYVMTLDGLDYTKMAMNLVHGAGTFWSPQFTATRYAHFYEHPPGGIWYFAIFFKIFGDSWHTDKIIIVVDALWMFAIMYLFFRRDFPKITAWLLWLPLLLIMSNPYIYFYIDTNKFESIETPLALTLLYWISSCRYKMLSNKTLVFQAIVVGLICVVGFEINGLLFLYIWAAYLICAITGEFLSLKKAILLTILMVAATLIGYALLMWSVPAAWHNNWMYLSSQLFPALLNQRTDVTILHGTDRFLPTLYYAHFIFPWVITSLFFFIIIKYILKKKNITNHIQHTMILMQTLLFYFLFACVTTLPLMLSGKVLSYYNYQTNIFLTLLLATLLTPTLILFFQKIPFKTAFFTSLALALIALYILIRLIQYMHHIVEYDRGYQAYKATLILTKYIPDNSIVSLPPHLLTHAITNLEPNLARFYNISLLPGKGCKYYIDSIYNILPPPKGYHKVNTSLIQLVLYERNHALPTCRAYQETKANYYSYGYPVLFLI